MDIQNSIIHDSKKEKNKNKKHPRIDPTKDYILFDSTYIKFQKKQTKKAAESRLVAAWGQGQGWELNTNGYD